MPDARLYETDTLSRYVTGLDRVHMRCIAAAIAVVAVGIGLHSAATHRTGSASARLQTEPAGNSIFGAIHPNGSDLAVSVASGLPGGSGVCVARFKTEVASELTERASERSAVGAPCASFDERFYFHRQLASFDERFGGAAIPPRSATETAEEAERPDNGPLPGLDLAEPPKGGPAVAQRRPEFAPVTTSPLASIREKHFHGADASTGLSLPLDADAHTAIYDIVARTVYLPNGKRLEAHSGLGSHLDDPRYVNTKGRGPTPPNVYNLALRERLFHGVRAIRLVPADDGKMFGRDGILAHSYMLGPSGQSNGCVSFRNYSAFLEAFLKGEIDRLVVVEHLAITGAKSSAASRG